MTQLVHVYFTVFKYFCPLRVYISKNRLLFTISLHNNFSQLLFATYLSTLIATYRRYLIMSSYYATGKLFPSVVILFIVITNTNYCNSFRISFFAGSHCNHAHTHAPAHAQAPAHSRAYASYPNNNREADLAKAIIFFLIFCFETYFDCFMLILFNFCKLTQIFKKC